MGIINEKGRQNTNFKLILNTKLIKKFALLWKTNTESIRF